MLRFSANLSLLFTELPLLERFAAARAAGFDAVEIQFPYEADIDSLRKALRKSDLELVLINVPAGDLMQGGDGLAGIPGREDAFRSAVEDARCYAEALGVSCINVLSGRQPHTEDLAPCLHTLAQNLRFAADAFQDIGVTTTFEAINTHDMPRFLISGVAQMQEMLEVVDHPALKMQFDIYHMARMGEDVAKELEDNIAQIGHIQFADIPGRGAPGSGTLPFVHLFNLIANLPYEGCCGAEYRPNGLTTESLGWLKNHVR